jgi:hypothetical protein
MNTLSISLPCRYQRECFVMSWVDPPARPVWVNEFEDFWYLFKLHELERSTNERLTMTGMEDDAEWQRYYTPMLVEAKRKGIRRLLSILLRVLRIGVCVSHLFPFSVGCQRMHSDVASVGSAWEFLHFKTHDASISPRDVRTFSTYSTAIGPLRRSDSRRSRRCRSFG